jgi:hypothetical protein
MSRDDHSPTEGTTRRGVLRGLGAATAGVALPAVSATTGAAERDTEVTATAETRSETPVTSLTADIPDLSPYSSQRIRYTEVQNGVSDFTIPEYRNKPGERVKRHQQSLVTHTGPRTLRNFPDQYLYTFNVQTFVLNNYVDATGNVVETAPLLDSIKHSFTRRDGGSMSFDDGSASGGTGVVSQDDAEQTFGQLRDDDTVRGAALNFALNTIVGQWPVAAALFNGYNAIDTALDTISDTTTHTDTFVYSNAGSVSAFRKFTVFVPKDETATIEIETSAHHMDYRDGVPDFTHTIELDPDTFVQDIGTHPFESSIRWLLEETPISGNPNSDSPDLVGRRFRPEESLTRAEFASMIDDALIPDSFSYDPSEVEDFVDIDGHWAEEKIERATAAGYISGYPDMTFRPDNHITKVEVLAALNGGEGYSGGDTRFLSTEFDDFGEIPWWGKQAVANVLATWGSIENYPDQRMLEPNENATRAEAAKYVYEAATV